MRIVRQYYIVCLFALWMSACGHSVHLIHTSDFDGAVPYEKGEPIIAEREQFVILGFASDTDYVEAAYQELLNQCSGRITGITTKFSSALGFMSWTNKLRMEGLCVKP